MMKKLLMLAVAALLIVGCSEQQLLDDYMSEVSEMSEMQEPAPADDDIGDYPTRIIPR